MQIKRDFVIIPGTTRDENFYREFSDQLATQDFCHRVYCIDNPGFGRFSHLKSPWRMRELVAHAHAQLDLLIAKDSAVPKVVIGHSLGGAVAFAWANQYPTLFQEMVFINGTIGTFNPLPSKRVFFHRLLVMGLCNALPWPELTEASILGVTINDPERKKAVLEAQLSQQRTAFSNLEAFKQAVALGLYYPMIMPTKAAGLVICSKNDRFVPPVNSYRIAIGLGLPLVQHETAGHDIMQEDPDFCVRTLGDFVQGVLKVAPVADQVAA